MDASARAAPFVLVLAVACGGAQPSAETATHDNDSAGERAEAPGTRLDGSRVTVWVPDGLDRVPGEPRWASPAGISVGVADTTISDRANAMAWTSGLLEGAGEGAQWESDELATGRTRFRASTGLLEVLVLEEGEALGAVLVRIVDPDDAPLIDRVFGSARLDPDARFDPMALMGTHITPAEPLALAEGSSVGQVVYAATGDPRRAADVTVLLQQPPPDSDLTALGELFGTIVGGSLDGAVPEVWPEGGEREAYRARASGTAAGTPAFLEALMVIERGPGGGVTRTFVVVGRAQDEAWRAALVATVESFGVL